MAALLGNLLVFGRLLRSLGLEVHVGRLLDIADALPHVNLGARDDVYHTCRALLVHRRDDLATFDRAFDAFWREHHGLVGQTREEAGHEPRTVDQRAGATGVSGEPAGDLRRGCRRAVIAGPADLERCADAGAQGLRGVHGERDRAGPRRDGTARMDAWRAPYAPLGPRAGASRGPQACARAERAHGRRRLQAATPDASHARAPGRAPVRHQRVDGALLAHAPPLRPRHRPPAPPRRGVRVLHRTDPRHQPASRQKAQRGGGRGLAVRTRLVRRHPHWRGAPAVPSALDAPHAPRRPGRAAHLGRLGLRRSGRAARADQAPPAELPSPDLAQPADWHPRLRPADAGTAGGAAVCGRLPARPDAEQPRGPGATLEHAPVWHGPSQRHGYRRFLHV